MTWHMLNDTVLPKEKTNRKSKNPKSKPTNQPSLPNPYEPRPPIGSATSSFIVNHLPHQARMQQLLRPLEAQDGPQQVRPNSLRARPILDFRIRSRVGRGGLSRGEERIRFEAGEVRCRGEDQNHKGGENFHGFGVEGGQRIGRESPCGVEERSHQRRG